MTTSGYRLWAILTVLAGLATLGVMVGFGLLPEVVAGQKASCYVSMPPVIAFEFARTAAEASALFGEGACRAANLTAMDAINRLDIAGYIPAYTLFAVFCAIFAARGARPPLVLLAILAAIGAFAADMVETTTLLKITANLDAATDAMTAKSSIAAWAKFAALAVHGLLVAAVCLRLPRPRWIVGLAMVLPALGTVAAAIDPARFAGLMSAGLGLGWIVMLVFAIKESVWPPKSA